jgi:alginate O-acetyltransferase complex protein AlgI
VLFNSHFFIYAFLPITLILFHIAKWLGVNVVVATLSLVSILFYCLSDVKSLPLLLSSITINYGAYVLLSRERNSNNRRYIFLTIIAADLLCIGYFKYVPLINQFFALLSVPIHIVEPLLPSGISFYTFTQLALLVDVYRGQKVFVNFQRYTLFVNWFPHIIAGPVLHHGQMLQQFSWSRNDNGSSFSQIERAIVLFVVGLASKILVADEFAKVVNQGFHSVEYGTPLSFFEAYITVISYSFQLFFDFAGYSNMAIGISLLFGIDLPKNFRQPYSAIDLVDFWQRWHISLSTFLRDYVYIPLGGNRKGSIRKYVNLLLTMVIGGIWHGATLNFVVWGSIHGLALILNHVVRNKILFICMKPSGRIFCRIVTFMIVTLAWIPFRAKDLHGAFSVLLSLVGANGVSVSTSAHARLSHLFRGIIIQEDGFFPHLAFNELSWMSLFLISIGLCHQRFNVDERLQSATCLNNIICRLILVVTMSILFIITVLNIGKPSEFLYFRF